MALTSWHGWAWSSRGGRPAPAAGTTHPRRSLQEHRNEYTCAHDAVSLNLGPRPSQHSYLDTVLLGYDLSRFWSTSMGCG